MSKHIILGLTERVYIISSSGEEEKITARIDTGATASSIDVRLAVKLKLGPLTKMKVIKSASGVKKRPVVRARIRIEGQVLDEEFSIADRSHMTYPVLIGQNILKKGNFLIDPHKEAYS